MVGTNYPQGWHAYVKAHRKETAGYVVAQTGHCLDIKDQETFGPRGRGPGRAFKPLRLEDLGRLAPPRSWFLGILLCPGDILQPVLDWVLSRPKADRGRIVLYLHPGFDQAQGAGRMEASGLGDLRTTVFTGSWNNFRQVYGNDHSWQVWTDRPQPS